MVTLLTLLGILLLIISIITSIIRLKLLVQFRRLISVEIDYYMRKVELDENLYDYMLDDKER